MTEVFVHVMSCHGRNLQILKLSGAGFYDISHCLDFDGRAFIVFVSRPTVNYSQKYLQLSLLGKSIFPLILPFTFWNKFLVAIKKLSPNSNFTKAWMTLT